MLPEPLSGHLILRFRGRGLGTLIAHHRASLCPPEDGQRAFANSLRLDARAQVSKPCFQRIGTRSRGAERINAFSRLVTWDVRPSLAQSAISQSSFQRQLRRDERRNHHCSLDYGGNDEIACSSLPLNPAEDQEKATYYSFA